MSFSGLFSMIASGLIIAAIAIFIFTFLSKNKSKSATPPPLSKNTVADSFTKIKCNKRFLGIAFIIIAIVSFIFAIVIGAQSSGSYELSQAYGGDAYTGIQNAAAQTANNIMYSNEIIKLCACGIFVILGSILAILGIYFVSESNKEASQASVDNNSKKKTDDTSYYTQEENYDQNYYQ